MIAGVPELQEWSAILFSTFEKTGVAPDVEQAFDVEQPKDVEQAFDVEQPKDVEQAQRCGTGPKMWNRPKEVEQAQRSTIPAF